MGFKSGLIVGLGIGYYYGARAGRERFEEIEDFLDPLRDQLEDSDLWRRLGDLIGSVTKTIPSPEPFTHSE